MSGYSCPPGELPGIPLWQPCSLSELQLRTPQVHQMATFRSREPSLQLHTACWIESLLESEQCSKSPISSYSALVQHSNEGAEYVKENSFGRWISERMDWNENRVDSAVMRMIKLGGSMHELCNVYCSFVSSVISGVTHIADLRQEKRLHTWTASLCPRRGRGYVCRTTMPSLMLVYSRLVQRICTMCILHCTIIH